MHQSFAITKLLVYVYIIFCGGLQLASKIEVIEVEGEKATRGYKVGEGYTFFVSCLDAEHKLIKAVNLVWKTELEPGLVLTFRSQDRNPHKPDQGQIL